jgi:hypothetical protein
VHVETPQGRIKDARLYVRDGHAMVFVAKGREVIVALEASGVTETERPQLRRQPFIVRFEDGGTWEATRAGGCGCGSPLKKFRPSSYFPVNA